MLLMRTRRGLGELLEALMRENATMVRRMERDRLLRRQVSRDVSRLIVAATVTAAIRSDATCRH
jgi:hypothetical protein